MTSSGGMNERESRIAMPKTVNKGFEETYEEQTVISGIRCLVKANLKNGIIYASVSVCSDNYNHKIDFKQSKSAGKTNLSHEVKRLFFIVSN